MIFFWRLIFLPPAAGGDKPGHAGDAAVHGVRVRGVQQRARRPASHLQTGKGVRGPAPFSPALSLHQSSETSGSASTWQSHRRAYSPFYFEKSVWTSRARQSSVILRYSCFLYKYWKYVELLFFLGSFTRWKCACVSLSALFCSRRRKKK